MSEIEILRGAKIRVSTETAQVGDSLTPISQIADVAFIEADHRIGLVPRILLIAGPIAGAALYLLANSVLIGAVAGLILMAAGAILYRNSWLHEVTARLHDGATPTLFHASRKGDALLFHAAIQKAIEIRANAATGG